MENKPDLGSIAYEAYCAKRNWVSVRGEPLPIFAEQSQDLINAWQAAANAVAIAITEVIRAELKRRTEAFANTAEIAEKSFELALAEKDAQIARLKAQHEIALQREAEIKAKLVG